MSVPMTGGKLRLVTLNEADQQAFAAALGFVFEHSPWIAAEAWIRRPFASRDELLAAMRAVLSAADLERKLTLIRAHPDLATRVTQADVLTAASAREQASAGLDGLMPEEYARFSRLNAAYRVRFGFPFIICVRDNDRASILAAFDERLDHAREQEIRTALDEVCKIAGHRLADVVEER